MSYWTILGPGRGETVIKKSTFIGYAAFVKNEEEAKNFVAKIKAEHPKARHHASAWVVGVETPIPRYDDDKEPSGTAGPPILALLEGDHLKNVCVVVVRYFGGILLGTGGLVRAYSEGARLALEDAGIVEMREFTEGVLEIDYTFLGSIQYLAAQMGAELFDEAYTDRVSLRLRALKEDWQPLILKIEEVTSARYELSEVMTRLYPSREGKRMKGDIHESF